ncbi:MAG: ABC transporter ATP-binding protein [Anaerovoracaceae bacterium]|nr:ABC transporter ATP-binding protein [Bacillota bacterium]MDY2670222.1 ABC transporter ATP-binding protein [Anaerovoracaceae bacterium]
MKLEINSLACGYEKGKPLVRDVSLTLVNGDICCILGRNGVGKSTMFKTILGLLKPLSGKVMIDGEDTSGWNPEKLAGSVAYVAQSHTPPFPYLVEEMVMMSRMSHIGVFGKPGKKDEEIVDSLINELGIDYLRGKPYTEVSGGERQMVMIARALAQEPKILVLDEPTANLDYGNKVVVLDTLKSMAGRGICTIFTTHDPEQALLLDAKTAVIIPGEEVIFGDSSKVVTEKNLKKAYKADIRVVEIVDDTGHPTRVCIPMLHDRDEAVRSRRM